MPAFFLSIIFYSPRHIFASVQKRTVQEDHYKTYVMKKFLLLIMTLSISGAIMAQVGNKTHFTKSFLAFTAGPSFPGGDYGKTNLLNNGTNEVYNGQAGFAKTGYNLSLNYGYQVGKNYGLAASTFYTNNRLNNAAVVDQLDAILESGADASLVKLDHWQWYGLSVGPMINCEIAKNFAADLRVMGGVANVNSPKVMYGSVEVVREDWKVAPLIQTGVDLRIGLGNNLFILANADYLYMRPKFTINFNVDDEVWVGTPKQKISVINLTGGIGIRF